MPVSPTIESVARTKGGAIVLNATYHDRARVGLPLHRVDSLNVISFREAESLVTPHGRGKHIRRLAPRHSGGLWTIPFVGDYLIEAWSEGGERSLALKRDVPWYPPSDGMWDLIPGRPPYPRMLGIWEDTAGRIWTAVLVPEEDWQDGTGAPRILEGREIYRILDRAEVYDTILEVIDPKRGAVLYSQRFDNAISIATSQGFLGEVSSNEDYTYRLNLFVPTLSRN